MHKSAINPTWIYPFGHYWFIGKEIGNRKSQKLRIDIKMKRGFDKKIHNQILCASYL